MSITLALLLLLIMIFTPSFSAVKLSPGTPNQTSVTIDKTIIFNNVTLTIRSAEAIPVNSLLFQVFRSSDNGLVAQVMFSIFGIEISDTPTGAFTLMNITNTSNLPYQSEGSYYGVDEETGENVTGFDHGYGYGTVDLSILYKISYTTHVTGTFYAKLFVNSIIHTYASGASLPFTVKNAVTPPPPSPPDSNQAPIANPDGPYIGYVDKPITFNGADSTDDTAVTGYRWDWTNDGNYDTNWSTSAITTYIYTREGGYTLCLQVKDSENLTDTAITTVNVLAITDNFQAPIAKATGPMNGLTYQQIQFDGSNSYGVNASIVNYTWAFGDGTYAYNITATHAYETAGIFTVYLTITDSHNLQAIDTITTTIELDANQNGIPDIIDEAIGVNITLADLHSLSIGGSLYYLVDTNGDDIYDIFYNPTTNTTTILGQQNGKQLIDINGDGQWEYFYYPTIDATTPYEATASPAAFPWFTVGITSIVIIIVVILLLVWCYRTGRI